MLQTEKKRYLENPDICPKCGSSDIIGARPYYDVIDLMPDTTTIHVRITCGECGARWLDIYTLQDVELLA